MRVLHTADWQIGKPFLRFGEKSERLRAARLDAIENLGRLAQAEGVAHILVAGDVFDSEAPSRETLHAPIERMRAFSGIIWHLLPGNHDPHRPGGVWDRFRAIGHPDNLIVHVSTEPCALDPTCWLLPAPLTNKAETRDLTLAMESTPTPSGAIRIGLAHGTVVDFSGSDGDASNPIDPARPDRAGLSYLALGDWHRTQQINDRVWYAGTPEPDRHGSQTVGRALLVTIDAERAVPHIEERNTGTFCWQAADIAFTEPQQLSDFEAALRRDAEPLSRLILKLALSGAASLTVRKIIDEWIERLQAAVCHLDIDDSLLRVRPEDTDLESIDFDGVLRKVAEHLRNQINDMTLPEADRRVAEDALVTLYIEGTANA
jgi:DNA repair exonuclease SbcCD nuclease subunit